MVSVTIFAFRRRGTVIYGAKRLFSKVIFTLFLATQPAIANGPDNALFLLAFGDSLTQGYGLPAKDGFAPQLQAWMAMQGLNITVVNGGVSGDTTAGGAGRIDWSLTDEIDAVIVALGGNDALRGLPVAAAYLNLASILNNIQSRNIPVLLVGIHAPTNFGETYTKAFDAMFLELAETHNIPLFADFLQGIVETGNRQSILQTYLQADALHPNAKGVKLIVARMGPTIVQMLTTPQ